MITDSLKPRILLTGATGYVGGQLLKKLEALGKAVRCLTRNPDKPLDHGPTTELAQGDVLDAGSLGRAMDGIETAYYMIHSMGSSADFRESDRRAAENFLRVATEHELKRIIYLGGLGDEADSQLSPHLRSRHEVGQIFRKSGLEVIEFRASAVLGSGSLSFELIRSLTERLPVMICPRWMATPTQPIATDDLLQYLLEALDLPLAENRIYEIGGSEVVTYGGLIQEYARQRGLRRSLISVPVLTPYLSGLWLGLVTPASAQVGRHLIEGLRNPTVVKDPAALRDFSVQPMGVAAAIARAMQRADAAQ